MVSLDQRISTLGNETSTGQARWGTGSGVRGGVRASPTPAASAPSAAKPAPTQNAAEKPPVSAAAAVWPPSASAAVRDDATVASTARPSEPPNWRDVLISPEARPASSRRTPVTPAIVTGTNEKPSPVAVTTDGTNTRDQ